MSARPHLRAVTPLLVVADLPRSIAFYRDRLGYADASVWGKPPCFAMTHRDGFDLMLSLAGDAAHLQPNGRHDLWDLYLKVDDLAAEITALHIAGVPIDKGPTDTEYGMREIEVQDPDGHRICLAEDLSGAPRAQEVWSGTLDLGSAKLRLLLKLRRGGDGWLGDLDSPDQNATNLPIASIVRDAAGLRFDMPAIGAAFAGMFAAGGNELAGAWQQRGRTWPLVFTRG
ncbi:MAG: VOC family protein [Planctomycetes bacterium]|nr:VOC family protein [Planctomycetota bacterium]